ncbi:MAG: hypothetical protein P8015_04425 [Acidihalobacter sp.]
MERFQSIFRLDVGLEVVDRVVVEGIGQQRSDRRRLLEGHGGYRRQRIVRGGAGGPALQQNECGGCACRNQQGFIHGVIPAAQWDEW